MTRSGHLSKSAYGVSHLGGRIDRAPFILELVPVNFSESPNTWYSLGEIARYMEKHAQPIEACQRALESDSDITNTEERLLQLHAQ